MQENHTKMARSRFKKEFRRQIRLAIAAAIGFLIAYAWRDTIFSLTSDLVQSISSKMSTHLINFTSSLIITAVGVGLILLASRLLEEKR
jgi:Na+/H+ antiporter NhaC